MSHKKKLLENLSALYSLQFVNYLLPLFLLPYLIRVLQEQAFGVLSFSQALNQYFLIFTDYGFDLTATQKISLHRENPEQVSKIFWGVLTIKILLLSLSFCLLILLLTLWGKLETNRSVYLAAFLMVVGQVLFPVWFFQGLEKMKIIPVLLVSSRFLATLTVFIFVKEKSDLFLAVLIQSSGWLLSGVIALTIALRNKLIHFTLPHFKELRSLLNEGSYVFLSQLSSTLLSNTHILLLGMFTNFETVGIFSIGEKIIRAISGLSAPITKAIYPRVSYLFSRTPSDAMTFLKKVFWVGGIPFTLSTLILLIIPQLILHIITGASSNLLENILRVMAPIPLFIFLNNIYGTQILLNCGLSKTFGIGLLTIGLLTAASSLIFVPIFGLWGSVWIFTLSELLLFLTFYFFAFRAGFRLLDPL